MIQPLGNRVVVEPIERKHERFYLPPETTTFTPETRSVVTTTQGRVMAVGPQVYGVRAGDVIRCSDTCGQLFILDQKEVRVIREDDVACIL